MVVRMRHNRSQTGSTRSHHALKTAVLSLCKDCGSPKAPHEVCSTCGKYKGKQVIDVHAKIAKKEKRAKEKAKVAGK
ncbi:MAG: 50S ribosomal protein L32 [Patescibacteria group bacterium]